MSKERVCWIRYNNKEEKYEVECSIAAPIVKALHDLLDLWETYNQKIKVNERLLQMPTVDYIQVTNELKRYNQIKEALKNEINEYKKYLGQSDIMVFG